MLALVPHVVVSLFFLGSLIPLVPAPYRQRAQIAAHAFLGFFYLLAPNFLLGITVTGFFSTVHSFLQAYVASFHLGLAWFLYRTEIEKPQQSIIFSRAVVAFFCLFTRLFAAWHLSEKSTRGLLISDYFVCCAILSDGVWLLSELIRFYRNYTSMRDEVDNMCKLTTLWLEGKGSQYVVNALYADTALSLMICLFHFAFPQQILKLVIKPEHILDSHHYMWCRIFGALHLYPALVSLQARTFPAHVQVEYLGSRFWTQLVVFILNIFGHWILSVYSPNHITAFMVSGFYMSFLFSLYYRVSNYYEVPVRTTVRVETRTTKKIL